MNEKINTWETEIKKITEQFTNHFGKLSPEELNKKPDANTWSIAQNLDHIIKINESYYPIIKQVRNGSLKLPFLSKVGFITNMLGNFIFKSVSPDRKTKIKTFPVWEPGTGQESGQLINRFEKHQQELINTIKGSKDLLEKGTIISSPANKMIVYKLEKAFDILVEHEKRHLNQALEVLSQK